MQVPSGVAIVGAEHLHEGALAERGLARDLDQMGRIGRRLARAALGVGAGHIEVAQRHVTEIMRPRGIGEHDLGHHLGGAVGRHGLERGILAHRVLLGVAVDGGGRGEDEVLDAHLDRDLHQGARLDGVVVVVAERIGDRLRHHDRSGEMYDGVDAVLADDRANELLISRHRRRPASHSQAPPSGSPWRDCRGR